MRTDETRETRLSTDDIVGADRDHSTTDSTSESTLDGNSESALDGNSDSTLDGTPTPEETLDDRSDSEFDSRNAANGNGDARREDTRRDDEDAPLNNQSPPQDNEDVPLELFGGDEVERFRVEWREIQARFVDDPRDAVQGADHLVAEVMQSLASTFSDHKHELEGQWQDGSEAQTEDLRQALRRYRTFFNQLLSS